MTIITSLGYKYLWVDKYCIFAEDAGFSAQLKQMHHIYQNSILTIIAVAGSDSSHGLPRISCLREGCPQVQLSGRTLASVPKTIYEELTESTWNTRGWTFQEGLLSTRRVIFAERQLCFECHGYYRFEGLISSSDTLVKIHRPDGQGYINRLHNVTDNGGIGKFNRLEQFPLNRIGTRDWQIKLRIEEYSYRTLTYERTRSTPSWLCSSLLEIIGM